MTDAPFHVIGPSRPGPWLITCDHASNHVPAWINNGDLGISAADMARHIAWDVGAAGLALALAEALDSPCLLSNFSRLVIDPNRGEDDPTLVMKLYDGTIIPTNARADQAQITERLDRLYRPYHQAYAAQAEALDRRAAKTAICAIHSFTPQLQGRPARPWHVGVLSSHLDRRLTTPLLAELAKESDLTIGDNEPYNGHLPGDAIDTHALQQGRLNTLIELRNDLIATPEHHRHWAARLAPILTRALQQAPLPPSP